MISLDGLEGWILLQAFTSSQTSPARFLGLVALINMAPLALPYTSLGPPQIDPPSFCCHTFREPLGAAIVQGLAG